MTENQIATIEAPSEVFLAQGLPEYQKKVEELLRASVAPATRRAYASRLKDFFRWVGGMGLKAFPASPETVALYVGYLASLERSCATIEQSLAAIAAAHRAENLLSPTESLLVRNSVNGYKREHGIAPHKSAAATADVVRLLLGVLTQGAEKDSPKNIRNAAILALGFAGAFRRSELTGLNVPDLQWTIRRNSERKSEEILLITVRRSKTDQEGQGMTKAIFPAEDPNISPIALLKRWLKVSQIWEGPLFRRILKNGHITESRLDSGYVRTIIKETALAAELNLDLSAHSLRSGFVTTAIRQGKTERAIMNQTGHRSTQVLREYFQREDAVEDNAAKEIL